MATFRDHKATFEAESKLHLMSLIRAMGVSEDDLKKIDDNDIVHIISLVDIHLLCEIGVETCAPYEEDGAPCYHLPACTNPNCPYKTSVNISIDI